MMWDFSGGQDTRQRSRSRSPQPPQMRMPSPSLPSPMPLQNQDSYSYGYSGSMSPPTGSSYPPVGSAYPPFSPTYGQYLTTQDYTSIPRGPASPNPQFPTHIVHVIHHSSHHAVTTSTTSPSPPVPTHHKHKHHHRKRTHSQPSAPPPMMMPTPSQVAPAAPPQRVHFSYSEPVQVPTVRTVLQKPPPRHSHSHSYSHSQQPQGQALSHSHSHAQLQQPHTSHTYQTTLGNHPAFSYSTCTGRRRALCIGINYKGQQNELRGCVNDAKNVRKFLIEHGNYKPEDITLLTDDAHHAQLLPTRDNILRAMRRLVRGACQNDALFLHYSGHGGQTPDLDGDEMDGYDEVIFPLDFKTAGHITDDEMHGIMVKPLPTGCRLTALFDACHSGTVLDLPYIYSAHGRLKGTHVAPAWLQAKSTPADVISWSGCTDAQTSADTFQGGLAVGAMSYAFIEALSRQPKQTYQQLLHTVRHILNPRYSQKPQLGSSHHIDTNLNFIF